MVKKSRKKGSNNNAGLSSTKGASSVSDRKKTIGKNLNFGASEAYKLLRVNLTFSMADEEGSRVIGVTSALRGEGKSTTSINLAYTLAQTGKRVLLLEADMRIPVLASLLRLEEAPGLSHVLAGINSLNEAIHKTPMHQNVSLLPAGEIPPNPSELLSSKRMKMVMEALVSVFEYIIIDLPPINAVSDGLAISGLLSGMIMVVRQNYCDQQALAEAMQRMELLKVKVLGFVFNGVELTEKRYKKYGKQGYYGHGQGYTYGYGKKDARFSASSGIEETSLPTSEREHGSSPGNDV